MTDKKPFDDQAHLMQIQKHQLEQTDQKIGEIYSTLNTMADQQNTSSELVKKLSAQAQSIINAQSIEFVVDEGEELIHVATVKESSTTIVFTDDEDDEVVEFFVEGSEETLEFYVEDAGENTYTINQESSASTILPTIQTLDMLDVVSVDSSMGDEEFLAQMEAYASRQGIVRSEDPFKDLIPVSQRIELEKRIKEEFTHKKANCDKFDYMIAGTCGLIGGLVDIFFVGLPGTGLLGKWADDQVDNAVKGFAKLNGWTGSRDGTDKVASAIGFLERKFKVNYDHATTHATGGAVGNMSMSNHHIKSLGHSPDLVGLFFSILDQFCNTAHFVDKGKLISIDTEDFNLKGGNIPAKIFAGFVNWIGHLFSDVAGSSGGRGKVDAGRGSGIPIPFYSLLQFLNVGSFGQHRQTVATIAVKVFEQGYDFRHGVAMAVPVLVTEILTRFMWVMKRRFYHKQEWANCLPSAGNPELRRMLLIGHGSLCLVDATDATLRSGGTLIIGLARINLIAWVRFGTVALTEMKAYYLQGSLDIEAADEYIDSERARLIEESERVRNSYQ